VKGKGKGKGKSKAVVSAATARGIAGNKSSARRRNHATAYGLKRGSEPSTFESFSYEIDREVGAMTERERLDALSAEIEELERPVWAYWRERKKLKEADAGEMRIVRRDSPEHVCRACGWLARYGERVCGGCGEKMGMKTAEKKYRPGGRKKPAGGPGVPVGSRSSWLSE